MFLIEEISIGDGKFLSKAKPSSPFNINSKDLAEISEKVHQRILEIEKQMVKENPQPFSLEPTENLVGDFERDVEKFRSNPPLFELLHRFKEIFLH